jgi:hypothetical protein
MNKTLAKWFTATTLAFTAVAATGTTGAFAAKKEQQQNLELVHVVYQGKELSLDGARLVKENLVLPVEAIAQANGGSVEISDKEKKHYGNTW